MISMGINHHDIGLDDETLIDLYRTMLLARNLDDRMWKLNRQGQAAFVVSSSGHEGAQVGAAFAIDPDVDWVLPYYRDVGMCLALGLTPHDILLGVFSRASDPSSGGRQMPNHWSFPSRHVFTASSAIATQYPHAAGIAYTLRHQGIPGVVLVSGGEGSTSEGDWHEAMNFAAIHRLPVVFLIENNHYAISVREENEVAGSIAERARGYGMEAESIDGNDALTVYATTRDAVERARGGGGPSLVEAQTYRYYGHTSEDRDSDYRTAEEVERWRKKDPILRLHQYLVEARLLPDALERELEDQVEQEVALAVEGALAAPEPDDPLSHVYAKPIEPREPAVEPEMAIEGDKTNLLTAINKTMHEIMASYSEVVVFGEDVADPKGGVFKATKGLGEQFGPDRSFNAPLAESCIVGVGIGMAAAGLRPIAEIQFADFIHPAFDQIVSEAARIHYRSDGRWTCPLVIRVPYGGGVHGGLYHSQSIEAFYTHIPGLKVVVPSTPADAKGLLWEAIEDPDPVMFLEPKKLYRLVSGPYPEGHHRVALGKAAVRRPGTDLTIIAYGAMAHFAAQAADTLAAEGVDAELIDLRSLRPLDWPTIEASVHKTGRVLIVHEDNEFGGFGAEIAAQVAAKSFEHLDAPIRRYGAPEVPAFPFSDKLEAMVMPNAEGIVQHGLELSRY
ncbi:MAG: tungsten formylmethanofuran dehydrogenase [Acidimicrobiia bacterium]|nr:tungsten formylmethanofuran dehydrogenase [Acidimicrobiia bacterium]